MHRRSKVLWTIGAVAVGLATVALSPPATAVDNVSLDPDWAGGAPAIIDIAGQRDLAPAAALQPDGKLLVAGYTYADTVQQGVIMRFDGDGTLDEGFASEGLALLDRVTDIRAIAVEPDGKIVLCGAAEAGALIARLMPDGSFDPIFGPGGDGLAFAAPDAHLMDIAVVGAGYVVSGVAARHDDPGDFYITRFLANGDIDTTFGTNGETVVDTGTADDGVWEETSGLVALDDGSFMVLGGRLATTVEATVMRFTPSGELDDQFNGSGWLALDEGWSWSDQGLPDTDGAAIVSEDRDEGSVLLRIKRDGSIDPTFGPVDLTDLDGWVRAIARDGEGRLVTVSSGDRTTLARFSRDGHADVAFGNPTFDLFDGTEVASNAIVQADGKIDLVGDGTNDTGDPDESNLDMFAARLSIVAPASDGGASSPSGGGPSEPQPTTSTTSTTVASTDQHSEGRSARQPTGYWLLGLDGTVYPFGDADSFGSSTTDAVDLESTPSGAGYWIVDARGRVDAMGDARYLGGSPALDSGDRVVSISATPTGRGYWLFTTSGRAIAYGDAPADDDLAGVHLNGVIVDSVVTPSGDGYYMVGSDGGVFAFGDATFRGSTGGRRLNAPVESLVPDPDGSGYWLVASDGGVFTFGAPFRGSLGGHDLNAPITGMIAYGNGYLMAASDGGVFTFSDRAFEGSLGNDPPEDAIVAIAALS